MRGKKIFAALLAAALLALALTGCGGKTAAPNATTASYEEMVAWLTQEGYISEQAQPVDINTTEGYVTDNTGGQYSTAVLADKAEDYDGLWLFWWDLENPTDNYEVYQNMKVNDGTMMVDGGAAVLQSAARNGAYAIAFAPDYAQQEDVVAAFEALPSE